MKVLFMGTPDFARESLAALYEAGYEIAGAVTQPDKPTGRGYKLTPPAVKAYALEKGIPVYQPETLKDGAFEETLREIDPEVIVVASYGKILPPYIIHYPKYGCINVHASLLPRFRGAAPIQRAIMEGDRETGITVMYMEEGLDTGDMLYTLRCDITEEDNFETLHDKLAALGGKAITEALPLIAEGKITPEKQDGSKSTYAAKITGDDAIIDFNTDREELLCRIRALSPIPLAVCKTPDGLRLKIISAIPSEGATGAKAGTVVNVDKDGFEVAVKDGKKIRVTAVLPEGKGRMSAADYVRGRRLSAGDVLSVCRKKQ